MRHFKSIVGLTVLTLAALSSCKSEEDTRVINMLPKTRSIDLTEAERDFVNKNNGFSFNFYRTLNEKEVRGKSNIVSPMSATFVLGMLNDGASGKTAEEITSVLGFGGGDAKAVNEFCRKLINEAPEVDPSVNLEIANMVIANSGKDVRLASGFSSDMKDYYDAAVTTKNFSNPGFLPEVNSWCSDHTRGMIPSILSPNELSPEDVIMLINAIYFKATWKDKFDANDTKNETFTAADGSTSQLPMMHRKAYAMYGQNDIYSTLYLPYGSGQIYDVGERWSMMVLLPNEGKTIDDVVNNLDGDAWEQNLIDMWNPEVDIKIPRFATDTETDLIDPISRMGAPTMFDKTKAEFLKMVEARSGQVWVGLMKQRAAIEVNEEGTKTSAVTVAAVGDTANAGVGRAEKVDFHCDRPFVYLIREASSGAIFFIGAFQGN